MFFLPSDDIKLNAFLFVFNMNHFTHARVIDGEIVFDGTNIPGARVSDFGEVIDDICHAPWQYTSARMCNLAIINIVDMIDLIYLIKGVRASYVDFEQVDIMFDDPSEWRTCIEQWFKTAPRQCRHIILPAAAEYLRDIFAATGYFSIGALPAAADDDSN